MIIREAQSRDFKDMWTWRVDKETIDNSFTKRHITKKNHFEWLKKHIRKKTLF